MSEDKIHLIWYFKYLRLSTKGPIFENHNLTKVMKVEHLDLSLNEFDFKNQSLIPRVADPTYSNNRTIRRILFT